MDVIKEENVELENLEIGEDKPQLTPGDVAVGGIKIMPVMDKNDKEKEIGKKVVLICKHPDREEPLELSKVKYEQGDTIKESGLWVNKDADGKLPYKSALACMLRHLGVSKIVGLKGAKIKTVEGKGGYLVVKAY